MNNKRLPHHYQNSTIRNSSSKIRYNSNGSLSKHYHSDLNHGRNEISPYVDVDVDIDVVIANRTFSSNRKKRKWKKDNSELVTVSIEHYCEEPTQYIDGIPAALRGEDGTYRRLHEHNITSNSEDDDSYDSSSPEWNSLRKNSKGLSCKWITFIFLLVFLVTMNIPFYNHVNSRSGEIFLHCITNNFYNWIILQLLCLFIPLHFITPSDMSQLAHLRCFSDRKIDENTHVVFFC